MAQSKLSNCRIAGVSSCVPPTLIQNMEQTEHFSRTELRKVVSMAGISSRYVSQDNITSTDLCRQAAKNLLKKLNWEPESVDGLILVTQTPDYYLPSSSCIIHRDLKLSPHCATFDIGLGCSGYPYGVWVASMMLQSGLKRILVLHGETPSLFTSPEDRSTVLLFGDAGTATAIEQTTDSNDDWQFILHTDGQGYADLIIPAGGFRDRFNENPRQHYLHMNGANLFNFTVQKVPALIQDTLTAANTPLEDVDQFIFHQSNRFIMKHIMKKSDLPAEKVPLTIEKFGNTGGASVPLTITQTLANHNNNSPEDKNSQKLLLLGYGVGLSWSSALLDIDRNAVMHHSIFEKESTTKKSTIKE